MPSRICVVILPIALFAVLSFVACSDSKDISGESDAVQSAVATSAAGNTATPSSSAPASPTPPTASGRKLGTSAGLPTTSKAPDFEPLAGAKADFGKLGASVYRIEMPANWNGELVMWAHGYRGPGAEVTTENPPSALRRTLIAGGYAWAASSYDENGYTPGIGADSTLALKKFFEGKYGKAKRTYISGASMGGNVVALSLEHFPDEYDGGLSVCGAVAGQEIIDYLFSWNLLAEYITGVSIPAGGGTTAAVAGTLAQFNTLLGPVTSPTQRGQQFESAIRKLTGGSRPFFEEGFREQYSINFAFLLLDAELRSLPSRAATNEGVAYAIEPGLGLTSEQLNSGVRRLKADPSARNAEAHPDAVPTSGRISDPHLTLHNTGDLFVPISQEQFYHAKVKAAGKSDLLVQRAIRASGHCKFSEPEMEAAFTDLVTWVEDGKKPAGEDLTGDLGDAGRAFTNPLRANDPGTP